MSPWSFIACFSLTCCLVSGQNAKYALVGEKVEFTGFSDNKEFPADILWKHIEGHIVHKVVHFDSSQEQSFGSYEGRVTLGWNSADLSISNLRYEDSGLYDLEILINNEHMTKRYELIVIDKVTKPTISCNINNASTSESAGKATLLCSLPSHSDQSLLKFQWSTNAKIHLGHMLKIPLGGEFDDHQYNCTVNNPLTQESAVFFAKDCYSETKAQAGLIAGVVVAVVVSFFFTETKAQAGLIAGVVVAVVVLLLILLLMVFFCLKKVRSNHEKSDVETQSNPGFPIATSGSEETRVLLDRAPTLPSKHALGHLNQRNDTPLDPSQKEQNRISRKSHLRNHDEAHMNELRETIRQRSSSDSEKNKVQDSKIPFSSPVKQLSILIEKKNGQANEAEPRDIVEEEVLENSPSDSETMNPELIALSSESSPEKNKDEDNKASHPPLVPQKSNLVRNFSALQKATENTNPKVIKEQGLDDPHDSGNPNEVSNDQSLNEKPEDSGFSSLPVESPHLDHPCTDDKRLEDEEKFPDILDKEDIPVDAEESSEQNKDEDNKDSHPPSVSQKSNLVQNVSALKKATEDTDPEDKRPVTNESSDSGNPNELPENENSGSKKEENEFVKSTPENDVQPPPVAKENSPLSQNSPESSPKAEHKQDIDSDECAMTNSGESSSSSLEESENEEQVPPASTPKKTDLETTVEEQKPALSETESEMETLQNK